MKNELRTQARLLRQQGMSVRDIAIAIDVAKSSVSLWVRDIDLTDEQVEKLRENQSRYRQQNKGSHTNRENYRLLRVQYQQEGRERAREKRLLHQAGCLLYWAEGAKHRNKVYFVNSDPNMVCLFMRFLREEMLISNEDIAVFIHCHYPDSIEQQRIEQYWLQLLGLQNSCLRKTQVKKGSDSRKNILINGVCGISVARSTRLAHHIYGAIQEYAGFDYPAWLF